MLVLTLVVICGPCARAEADSGEGQRAFLELQINGMPAGEGLVLLRDDGIWIDVSALADSGLADAAGERQVAGGREFVRLSSLAPQITGVLDAESLTVRLTVDPTRLGRRTIQMDAGRPAGLEFRRSTSAFVNYAVNWTGATKGSVAIESGVTLGRVLFTAQVVTDQLYGTRRGPATAVIDSRERLQRWTVGDALGGTGTLGAAVPIAGVTLSRAYELDPYFVRHPTVGLSGALAAPGTVDVYVNDRLVRREAVPAGTVTLEALPIPVGAGSARIVLRDAFGREQEIGGTYYVGTTLLAPGLHQYHYAAGVERLAASRSWEYAGGPVLLGTHRVGLTDRLTIGARLEGSADLVSGGPLAVVRVGRLGILELGGAVSGRGGALGHAWSTAYTYTSRRFSMGAAVRAAARQYATLSSRHQVRNPQALDAGATVGTSLWPGGSTSATWQAQRYHGSDDRADTVSLSNSLRLRRDTNLFVTVARTRAPWASGASLYIGLSRAVGHRNTVGASLAHEGSGTGAGLEAQRSAPLGEGYGYRVRADAGRPDAVGGDLRYQSRWGRYDVRQSHIDGERSTSLTAAGAIVAIGGRLHATRPIEESFALVRVPGARSVRTYVSHQEVGRTDAGGNLLVPGLLPYYGNVLSIADEDVPLASSVAARTLTVAPPYRGGAVVVFPVSREQRAMGRVVVTRGAHVEVPAYGHLVVTTGGLGLESPLGSDGEFYLEGLPPGPQDARIVFASGTCEFRFDVPASEQPVTPLGDLRCEQPLP